MRKPSRRTLSRAEKYAMMAGRGIRQAACGHVELSDPQGEILPLFAQGEPPVGFEQDLLRIVRADQLQHVFHPQKRHQRGRARYRDVLIGRARYNEIARGQISGIHNGLLKMVADPTGEYLLGVQIVGEGATELIHVGQIALQHAGTIDSFVENIFNFPTLAEGYRIAALDIVGQRQKLIASTAA